ncbi:MAG: DNA repair protein RecN, partial [bacterium]|jgi:DNA repair protein RecN (Recombination protein N)
VALAEKLAALSRDVQIFCITHLASIAARGDRHFFIEKRTEGKNGLGRTLVGVTALDPETRVEEIARMLGGRRSESVLQTAREMLTAN